jgi:hypothetical protein
MLPPRSRLGRTGLGRTSRGRARLDPNGYYARLGLDPTAPQGAITAAYRAKARLLHPDVPKTGSTEAFVAVKQAYDVLSNPLRRQEYDRAAQEAPVQPEVVVVRPARYRQMSEAVQPLPLSSLTITILVGLAAFLCLSLYEVATHLLAPTPVVASAGIRPNAASVTPLSPSAHRAVLYGPAPVRLAGTPNFYIVPAGSPAVLWQQGQDHKTLVPMGQLPPFSSVQAVRLIRQSGMLEVVINDQRTGFISADHLTSGDARAARSAYCSYNAGVNPFDGELLERRGTGTGTLSLENHAVQPAVVKLRDHTGAVAIAVFLGPSARVELTGLPEGVYRPEFAIGELWSRACNTFAAGMRAQRMQTDVTLPGAPTIEISPDSGKPGTAAIADEVFQAD